MKPLQNATRQLFWPSHFWDGAPISSITCGGGVQTGDRHVDQDTIDASAIHGVPICAAESRANWARSLCQLEFGPYPPTPAVRIDDIMVDGQPRDRPHIGLERIRQRAAALGGTLSIGPVPGGGVQIEVEVAA